MLFQGWDNTSFEIIVKLPRMYLFRENPGINLGLMQLRRTFWGWLLTSESLYRGGGGGGVISRLKKPFGNELTRND